MPTVFAQNVVSGTVTDANSPLPGVNIVVKGTSNGTQTDFDGKYSLNDVAQGATLIFSYLGFETQEIIYNGQAVLDVKLLESSESLNEVVVVGYGTQRKSDLTGAVSTVKGKELTVAPTPNLTQNLAGKLTGVIAVQGSSKPGAESGQFFIRGKSTFGNNGALVLVDGVERNIDRIDPNTIESITVLKDAASAAVYGARAANGVILVTTKRGASGTPQIEINSSVGFQSALTVPEMLNAGEFAQYFNEARINSGDDPLFTPEQVAQYQNGTLPSTDWWGEVIKDVAPVYQHGLTISGGGDNVRYFTSLAMLDQKGLYDTSFFKRFNVRSNVDIDLSKRFKLGIDLTGRKENTGDSSQDPFAQLLNSQPTSPAYVPDSVEPGGLGYNGVNVNPIGRAIRSGYNNTDWAIFQSIFKLEYDIPVEGLTSTLRYSYDHAFRNDKDFFKPYTYYVVDLNNDIYTPFESSSNTNLLEVSSQSVQQTTQFFLNYNREFGAHNLGAMFVYERIDEKRKNISAYREGFTSPAIDQLFAGGSLGQLADGGASETAREGYIGRVNYAFADKYLFQANVRFDGSYNFPKDKRWGVFPAFSAGWVVSKEKFLENVEAIQLLKVRASWGQFGNDRVSPFQYLSGYRFSTGSVFGTSNTFYPGIRDTGLPNPDITWETATSKNIGLDFALFNGKLSGEFNLFSKRTEDILIARSASIPQTFGADLPRENIGVVDSKGYEILLNYRGNIGDDFSFSISPNVTKAVSDVVFFDEPMDVPDRIRRTGRPFDQTYGYTSAGLFQSQEEIDNWADQDGQGNASLNTGDIKYVDINGDNKIDGFDISQIGKSTVPEVVFGLNIGFDYKGFDFSANFQGATGFDNYVYLGAFDLGSNALRERVLNSYREGNENARYPRTYFVDGPNNSRVSDFWLVDGSFVKLRNAELGYSLPQDVLGKIGLSDFRVYVSGNNLLTFSKYDFFDPENGGTVFYPQFRRINLGFNLKF